MFGELAGAAALLGVIYGLWRWGHQRWQRTIGARRRQQRQVETIVLGTSLAYVERELGPARFVRGAVRYYQLKGAWVTAYFPGDAVEAYCVTCDDLRFPIEAEPLTYGGASDIRLGYSHFESGTTVEYQFVMARRLGFWRGGAGGNPAGYESVWHGYNDAGAGIGTPVAGGSTINSLVVACSHHHDWVVEHLNPGADPMLPADLDLLRLIPKWPGRWRQRRPWGIRGWLLARRAHAPNQPSNR